MAVNFVFDQQSADALRGRFNSRHDTYRSIAEELGCSPETVGRVLRGESWKNGRQGKIPLVETPEFRTRIADSIRETQQLLAAETAGVVEIEVATGVGMEPEMPIDPRIQAKADFFNGKITREERDRILSAGEIPDFDHFLGGGVAER